jgi:hypothetical protein
MEYAFSTCFNRVLIKIMLKLNSNLRILGESTDDIRMNDELIRIIRISSVDSDAIRRFGLCYL